MRPIAPDIGLSLLTKAEAEVPRSPKCRSIAGARRVGTALPVYTVDTAVAVTKSSAKKTGGLQFNPSVGNGVSLRDNSWVTKTRSGSHRMMSSEVVTSTGSKPNLLQAVEKRRIYSASAS
jgi:hypothetical protein